MESAGRLIGKLNRARKMLTDEELVRAAWPLAVGPRVARYTEVTALVRGNVVVAVEDMIWQRQLNTLAPQIVRKLGEVAGPDIVKGLHFRPRTARRAPETAFSSRPVPADDADQISDPSLRRAYKLSRQKATA